MDNVGENIKKYRELKGYTREHMAAELDMSLSGYSKIERGETDLTLSRVKKIAQVLTVDVGQLLDFDVSKIFNLHNNNLVQGVGAQAENMYFTGDEYREKYIKLLESEIERLKKLVGEK